MADQAAFGALDRRFQSKTLVARISKRTESAPSAIKFRNPIETLSRSIGTAGRAVFPSYDAVHDELRDKPTYVLRLVGISVSAGKMRLSRSGGDCACWFPYPLSVPAGSLRSDVGSVRSRIEFID